MEHQQLLNSKKEIYDRINSIHKFDAILNYDLVTKKFKLIIEGTFKDGTMAKGVLTQADKQWIADLIAAAIKPMQVDIQSLKADMQNVKADIKAIKSCPTIKKELKK